MKCLVCKQPSVESMEFEAGNNADYQVTIPLCEVHCQEAEQDGPDFQAKYGDAIEEELIDSQAAYADALYDRLKEEGFYDQRKT